MMCLVIVFVFISINWLKPFNIVFVTLLSHFCLCFCLLLYICMYVCMYNIHVCPLYLVKVLPLN